MKGSARVCKWVRHRVLTSAVRAGRLVKNAVICTFAMVPKQRLPVTSSRAQPPIASSGLKSGRPWDPPAGEVCGGCKKPSLQI